MASDKLRRALEIISKAKPDGLDHAIDVGIIERAAKIARQALAEDEDETALAVLTELRAETLRMFTRDTPTVPWFVAEIDARLAKLRQGGGA